jgi:hypothetical protein
MLSVALRQASVKFSLSISHLRSASHKAILTRYIEEELTIIALANLAEVDLAQVTQHVAELIRQER